MSNDHLPVEGSVLMQLNEFKEGSDVAAEHHNIPNREAHLSFSVIHQAKAGMEPCSSEALIKDPHSQLTCCVPLQAENTSVSVKQAANEPLKNL